MKTFAFCMVCLFLVRIMDSRSTSDGCRTIKFVNRKEGKALVGHVIETLYANRKGSCDVHCLGNNACVSYNFGPSETGDKNICELNNSTDRKDLQPRKFFIYQGTENACHFLPCENNGTCQYGFTSKQFRCLCPAGFRGERCDMATYVLQFPEKTSGDYVMVSSMVTLHEFTVCFWIRTSDTGTGTVLSYATAYNDEEFTITHNDEQGFRFIIDRYYRNSYIFGNDSKWHQICTTWSGFDGSWKLFKDGKVKLDDKGYAQGSVINGGGILVLGQDQGSYGGGFSDYKSFKGELTGVNIWSRLLNEQEIADMSQSCLTGEGDVYKWSDFRAYVRGGVKFTTGNC